jgi:tetratricopeptide (TPR) repeat protein
LINQGRCDEAHPVLEQARRVMRASQFSEGAAPVEVQLARILIERGQLRQADELLEHVAAELRQLGKLTTALEASTLQAFARVGLGDPAGALTLLDGAVALAGNHAGFVGPRVAFTRAAALSALGRADEAIPVLRDGLRDAAAQNLPYERALLLRLSGRVTERAGREKDAAQLAEAEAIFRQLGVVNPPLLGVLGG